MAVPVRVTLIPDKAFFDAVKRYRGFKSTIQKHADRFMDIQTKVLQDAMISAHQSRWRRDTGRAWDLIRFGRERRAVYPDKDGLRIHTYFVGYRRAHRAGLPNASEQDPNVYIPATERGVKSGGRLPNIKRLEAWAMRRGWSKSSGGAVARRIQKFGIPAKPAFLEVFYDSSLGGARGRSNVLKEPYRSRWAAASQKAVEEMIKDLSVKRSARIGR